MPRSLNRVERCTAWKNNGKPCKQDGTKSGGPLVHCGSAIGLRCGYHLPKADTKAVAAEANARRVAENAALRAYHQAEMEKLVADHQAAMEAAVKAVKRKREHAPETETRPAKQQAVSSDDEDEEEDNRMCDVCGASENPGADDDISGIFCPKCKEDGRDKL